MVISNLKYLGKLPQLKEFLIDEEDYDKNSKYMKIWYYTTAWTARLARARIGVKEDIEKCISLLESEIKRILMKYIYA